MAGDEPSEDAEAGADGGGAAEGDSEDPSEEREPDEPGGAREDAQSTDGQASDRIGDAHGSADEAEAADADAAETVDETGSDGSEGPTDDGDEADGTATDEGAEADETGTNDEADVAGVEAVEAEAEALVEEMEAAVAATEPAEDPEARGDLDATGGGAAEEPADVEGIPMAPDHETDPEIDPPATPTPEDVGPDADLEEAPGPGPGDLPEDAEAAVDPADEPDAPGGVFGGGSSGPAEDREMPLAEHIEEMLKRLAVVIAVAGFVSLLVFPFAEDIINFLWYSILPGVESDIARPRLYGVLELLFTELKVASLAGLIVALPVMVYETYAFMRPGLYPHERRYYLAAIPTSLVLAVVGVAFAYFVVLPAIFVYFLYYSQDVATIGFALGRTFNLILLMMAYLAVVFQIPLFIMLAMMMGLVTRRWLAERRLLFWMAFLGVSFLFSFDPTGMAPIIVAATMIVLFEGTLLLTKWTGRE